MLNQDKAMETKEERINPPARPVRPDMCPEVALVILRARSGTRDQDEEPRADEKFRNGNRGVNWDLGAASPVRFKLGRILVSRKVQTTLTAEEISFCLDCHRRCICDGVLAQENAESLAGWGMTVPSPFNTSTLRRKEIEPLNDLIWVVTNHLCTRTVMRFGSELLFVRRKRARPPLADERARWLEAGRTDRFGRD